MCFSLLSFLFILSQSIFTNIHAKLWRLCDTYNCIINTTLWITSLLLISFFSSLAGVSWQETFLYWNHEQNWFQNLFLSLNTGALFGMAKTVVWFFFASYLIATMILIASRGKYKGQAKLPMIKAFILFPLFLLIQVPLDIVSIFIRNFKWKKIPHGESKKR